MHCFESSQIHGKVEGRWIKYRVRDIANAEEKERGIGRLSTQEECQKGRE